MSSSLIIKIDNREKKIIKEFDNYKDINICIQQLDIGDIIISNQNCNILIERKTICDVMA